MADAKKIITTTQLQNALNTIKSYVDQQDSVNAEFNSEVLNFINTDVFSPFTGATVSNRGGIGMVPAPAATNVNMFLCGDGTWKTPEVTLYDQTVLNVMPSCSMAFDMNGMILGHRIESTLSAGNLAYENAAIIYISSNVRLIEGGTMSGCYELTDIYVNQPEHGQHVDPTPGLPEDVNPTIHYNDSEDFSNFNPFDMIFSSMLAIKTKLNIVDRPISDPEILGGYSK